MQNEDQYFAPMRKKEKKGFSIPFLNEKNLVTLSVDVKY